MVKKVRTYLLIAIWGIILSACSGSDSDSKPQTTSHGPNLTINVLEANSLDKYEVSDTLRVDYQLVIEELSAVDVQIDFYLVHALEDAETVDHATETEIEETHLLTSVVHTGLDTGALVSSFEAEIPLINASGKFWIVAFVDPENEIAETDETDNHPNIDNEDHLLGDFPAVEIEIEALPTHEFIIVEGIVDEGLVILDSPEYHTGSGEHHSDIIGHIDAVYHGSEAATASLIAEVKINGAYEPLKLWDAETKRYVESQLIKFEFNGDEHFFGFDAELSDTQRATLFENYDAESTDNTIDLRLTLEDATDVGEEHAEENNSLELSLPLFFFDRFDPTEDDVEATGKSKDLFAAKGFTNKGNTLSIDGSFNKAYGDSKKFKVGMDLGGELKLDLLEKAASVEAGAAVEMWIFRAKNTIFSVNYDAQAYASGVNTGYESEMIIFNTVVFEDEYWNAKFEKTFEKSWEEERTLVQARFTVGPIPIRISAGIRGSVGFELTMGYALSELYVTGDVLTVDFNGYAEGGINLLLVEAGITINLNIINNVLALDSSANLALLDDGNVDPRIEYAFSLTDDIDVISGKFGLFAKVKGIKWCKKWGIPYPCGKKTRTYYLWLYQTPSVFSKSWTIYEKEGAFSL